MDGFYNYCPDCERFHALTRCKYDESSVPASGSAWQPMKTAPKNCTHIRVLMKDGAIHEDVHWAQDLSGEEQLPFMGWFIPSELGGYREIGEPIGWMPQNDLDQATSKEKL